MALTPADRADRSRFARLGRARPYAWRPVLAGLPVVVAALALITLRAAGITALPAELIVLGTAYGTGILGRDLLLHHRVFR
jgi:hypothetical protein